MSSEEQFQQGPTLENQAQTTLEKQSKPLARYSSLPIISTIADSRNSDIASRNAMETSIEDQGSEYFSIKLDENQNHQQSEQSVGRLHRMNVTYLEAKILLHHKILFAEGEEKEQYKSLSTISRWNDLGKDMAAYTRAIQNYRYWAGSSVDFTDNLGGSSLVNKLLSLELDKSSENPATPLAIDRPSIHELRRETMKEKEVKESKQLDERVKERQQKRHERLRMAVLGGGALIIPMLIMTLHKTLLTTLLTASLAILAVGIALALLWEKAKPQEVIGVTAAYAAVLVVMVGTGDVS